MESFKSYENAKVLTESQRLPVGGYVVKILNAEEQKYTWGRVLLISFDIAEGDYKDFYANNYRNQTLEDKKWKGTYRLNIPKDDGTEQDGLTADRFKTDMVAIEESNNGFHWDWDENKLKGKLVGALFNNKEYNFNGKSGFYTNCRWLRSVDTIRSGNFKIPKDSFLSGNKSSFNTDDYEEIDTSSNDDDLPF